MFLPFLVNYRVFWAMFKSVPFSGAFGHVAYISKYPNQEIGGAIENLFIARFGPVRVVHWSGGVF